MLYLDGVLTVAIGICVYSKRLVGPTNVIVISAAPAAKLAQQCRRMLFSDVPRSAIRGDIVNDAFLLYVVWGVVLGAAIVLGRAIAFIKATIRYRLTHWLSVEIAI